MRSQEPSETSLQNPEPILQSPEPSELPSDGQIILGNEAEDQSHNGQSESKDVNHCGSLAEVKQEVVQEEDKAEDCFPPPPPPVYFEETIEEKEDASSRSSSQQPSPTYNEIHQESSRKPFNPAPSRFAEAVALRVQRSRLRSTGKGLDAQVQSRPLVHFAHTVVSLTDPHLGAILHSYTWVPKESAALYILIQPWPWRNSKELCEVETSPEPPVAKAPRLPGLD
ncbi:hypothetical protein KUCAC02_000998 [Chaenocephalus aceratus]|uniref:Uncharacterized protein n=1 Tax=Chaenocephalus aceratus TaxID=36190 RepID=A0ACB9XWC2_CHAAC|nr:hypothetical protein KUCAC02_000998 [Chaenocephalus aceratus]